MNETTKQKPAATPYQNFKKVLVCNHEAGHVVVGHVLGWRLAWAKVGNDLNGVAFKREGLEPPFSAPTKREKFRRISALRRALAVYSAGHVAATIHQQVVEERGFSYRDEARAYRINRQARISQVFPRKVNDVKSDYGRVVACAEDIYEGRLCASAPFPILFCSPLNYIEPQAPLPEDLRDRDAAILVEIRRAEDRAERILKRHWKAVCAIACALHQSRAGHLSRGRLLRLLNDHGVEARA
jgi:hypothetical protein